MAAPAAEVEAEAAAGTAYVPEDDDLDSTEEEDEEELEEEEEESDEEKKPEPAPIQPPTDNGERKRQRIEIAEKKPAAIADDSRRLFQRLFSDEDEIAILQGFLDFNSQRSGHHHHHHDTAPFYEQIKTRLQLDFNKNQLVEKLRRLKKKYRNIANKKEYAFKTPHEQATFDLSRRIWGASVFARDDEEEDEPPAGEGEAAGGDGGGGGVEGDAVQRGGRAARPSPARSSWEPRHGRQVEEAADFGARSLLQTDRTRSGSGQDHSRGAPQGLILDSGMSQDESECYGVNLLGSG